MAGQGIRQFLDIGSGLPTVGNVHEIAQEIAPEARVVYVDNDPVVQAFGRALLATNANTTVAAADMRCPDGVLNHPETVKLIDFKQPVCVLMIAVAHYMTDKELPAVMSHLRDALVPGSYLVVSHSTSDGKPRDVAAQLEAVFAESSVSLHFRTHDEIARIFDGFDLVDPGLVTLDAWRPDPHGPAPEAIGWVYGAVGRLN